MTEQKEETKPSKPLTLSTTARSGTAAKSDATQVRQKFSHGRTRPVTVEVHCVWVFIALPAESMPLPLSPVQSKSPSMPTTSQLY